MDLQTFCERLPKIELHAHLNGSIGESTIQKLITRQKGRLSSDLGSIPESWQIIIAKGEQRTLEECFKMFQILHELVSDVEAVTMVAEEVVSDFAKDGVVYLELRTTPRANPKCGMTKQTYVEAVLDGIQRATHHHDIQVRLLLSIDRGKDEGEATENVVLAAKCSAQQEDYCQGKIVGIDFSGNPNIGNVDAFLPALRRAKELGLKLSVHVAEIAGCNEEISKVLSLQVDRLGHGTFLHPDRGGKQLHLDHILQNTIPIELCLTSNVKCKTVEAYVEHHFNYWFKRHLVVLCTDDKGIFSTTLSNEYKIAGEVFSLSFKELWRLSMDAIDLVFDDRSSLKEQLREHWKSSSCLNHIGGYC